MTEKFDQLIALARSRSSVSRRRLFENIADLFLSDEGRLTEHERALMQDILLKLLETVEKSLREELADALSRSGIEMPALARALANDEIEIARPLLEKSKLLADEDLIEIIRIRTDEHRLAIALRENLDEPVTDALVEYGDTDVIEALLNNHDAQISKRAMEYLVAESRRVDRFQEPLLTRSDLPAELAYRMYWWVAAALRKYILSNYEIDETMIETAIKRASEAVQVDIDGGSGAYAAAERLVRRMAETRDLTFDFLIDALRQRRIAVFVAGLAHMAALDFRTGWRIFSDPGGESLALLCRAVGMERSQFSTIYLLVDQARDGDRAQSTAVLKRVTELFDSVDPKKALRALRFWQRESAYQMAQEELENVR